MLLKLIPSFQPRYFTRDQVVLHEGFDQVSAWGTRYLFIVKEGEFEVVKKVRYAQREKVSGIDPGDRLDVVRFLEARHGEAKNTSNPSEGPLLLSPREA